MLKKAFSLSFNSLRKSVFLTFSMSYFFSFSQDLMIYYPPLESVNSISTFEAKDLIYDIENGVSFLGVFNFRDKSNIPNSNYFIEKEIGIIQTYGLENTFIFRNMEVDGSKKVGDNTYVIGRINGNPFVQKLNDFGIIEWSYRFGHHAFYDIAYANGELFLLSQGETEFGEHTIMLTVLDSTGEFKRSKDFYSGKGYDDGSAMYLSDSTILVVGKSNSKDNTNIGLSLIYLDLNLNILWNQTIRKQNHKFSTKGITADIDNYYVYGDYIDEVGKSKNFISTVSYSGEIKKLLSSNHLSAYKLLEISSLNGGLQGVVQRDNNFGEFVYFYSDSSLSHIDAKQIKLGSNSLDASKVLFYKDSVAITLNDKANKQIILFKSHTEDVQNYNCTSSSDLSFENLLFDVDSALNNVVVIANPILFNFLMESKNISSDLLTCDQLTHTKNINEKEQQVNIILSSENLIIEDLNKIGLENVLIYDGNGKNWFEKSQIVNSSLIISTKSLPRGFFMVLILLKNGTLISHKYQL